MHAGLDLAAPILPGEAAGSCHLGQPLDKLRVWEGEWLRTAPILQPTGLAVYRSDAVDLWVTPEGIIEQIGVHRPYWGTLFGRIRLGMTIDDIEHLVGPCTDSSADDLSVRGVRGLVFDVAWRPDHVIAEDLDFKEPKLRFSPVLEWPLSEFLRARS